MPLQEARAWRRRKKRRSRERNKKSRLPPHTKKVYKLNEKFIRRFFLYEAKNTISACFLMDLGHIFYGFWMGFACILKHFGVHKAVV